MKFNHRLPDPCLDIIDKFNDETENETTVPNPDDNFNAVNDNLQLLKNNQEVQSESRDGKTPDYNIVMIKNLEKPTNDAIT